MLLDYKHIVKRCVTFKDNNFAEALIPAILIRTRTNTTAGERRHERMKHCIVPLFAGIMLLLLTACAGCDSAGQVLVPITPLAATPTPVQQPLPKRLFNPKYPVMDWVFNQTCSRAVSSYSGSQIDTTIAYDSAAWLYPSDGHLVQGFQDC